MPSDQSQTMRRCLHPSGLHRRKRNDRAQGSRIRIVLVVLPGKATRACGHCRHSPMCMHKNRGTGTYSIPSHESSTGPRQREPIPADDMHNPMQIFRMVMNSKRRCPYSTVLQTPLLSALLIKIRLIQPGFQSLFHSRPFTIRHGKPVRVAAPALVYHIVSETALRLETQPQRS